MNYRFTSAISSHVGIVRSNNQDSGFAGANLFFVADGMGGHAGGDVASALVTKYVAQIDGNEFTDPQLAAQTLANQLQEANSKLSAKVQERPELSGLGTTFSGFFTVGDKLAIAHIGDSRIYRFRKGELSQITADHTFVQRLVDSGQITEEEAKTHPRRSVLMRVLGDLESDPEIDTLVHKVKVGDIWLLCSDGLCGYVEEKTIRNELRKHTELQQTVDALIDAALANGAPDNVTVALVIPEAAPAPVPEAHAQNAEPAAAAQTDTDTQAAATPPAESSGEQTDNEPQGASAAQAAATSTEPATDTRALPVQRFVGSAAGNSDEIAPTSTNRIRLLARKRRKMVEVPEAHFEPRVDEYLAELIAETKRRNWRRRAIWALAAFSAAMFILLAGFFAYRWTQTLYYVGADGDSVVIYQGVPQDIGPFKLSQKVEDTNIPLTALDAHKQRQIQRTLSANSLPEARNIIARLGVISND